MQALTSLLHPVCLVSRSEDLKQALSRFRQYVLCRGTFCGVLTFHTNYVQALTGLFYRCSPLHRAEGCSDVETCLPNGIVFCLLSVGLPAGLVVAQSATLDSGFWPSPIRCAMHSLRWSEDLFDIPMGSCLGLCLVAALR